MNEIVKHVISSLEGYRDEKRIEFAKKSYPTKAVVTGVTVPNEKVILKELKELAKAFSGTEKLSLAKKLIETGGNVSILHRRIRELLLSQNIK